MRLLRMAEDRLLLHTVEVALLCMCWFQTTLSIVDPDTTTHALSRLNQTAQKDKKGFVSALQECTRLYTYYLLSSNQATAVRLWVLGNVRFAVGLWSPFAQRDTKVFDTEYLRQHYNPDMMNRSNSNNPHNSPSLRTSCCQRRTQIPSRKSLGRR